MTGNPTTLVRGAIYDADSDIYLPQYGRANAVRLPDYMALDLRVDYTKTWRGVRMSRYLDI